MGPETSKDLFGHVEPGQGIERRLAEEVTRRAVLAGTLHELSDAFSHADAAKHQVTEPLLVLGLAALAQVQTSRMGVTGSNPIEAIDRGYSALRVRAHAAPPHDRYYSDVAGQEILTRAIKILPNENGGLTGEGSPNVEFFGLNMHIADIDNADSAVATILTSEDAALTAPPSSGLVIVGADGGVATKNSHISGETPILAVRNTDTQDAKVYSTKLVTGSTLRGIDLGMSLEKAADRGPIFVGDDDAYISASGGRFVQITALRGLLAMQAASEFTAATQAIRQGGHNGLTDVERAAMRSVYTKDV